MSARLRIGVRKTMVDGEAQVGSIADIHPIPDDGPADRRSAITGIVIPAGHSERADVPVAPGRYLVQGHLPSGELVSEQVSVGDGETASLWLQPQSSQREWLGWQHLMAGDLFTRRDEDATGGLELAPPPSHPSAELWALELPGPGAHHWAVLATAFAREAPRFRPPISVFGAAFTSVHRSYQDAAFRSFLVRDPLPPYPHDGPSLAWIARGSRADIMCLPLPWTGRNYERIDIDIAAPNDPSLPVSVVVHDPQLGSLLGYLASGALPTARRMVELDTPSGRQLEQLAEHLMELKRANPYAAVAGAYVLLQNDTSKDAPAHWHAWIENLAQWFPWLPDGAVLRAALRLRRATCEAEIRAAITSFEAAFERGIPVYTAVLMLLLDGMTALVDGASDEAHRLRPMLKLVRIVALHSNLRQPFTTIQLGAHHS